MKKSGWAPGTIFDVGVATGTPGLYGIFDDVRYVLIDPVAEVEPFMKQCCEEYPGSIYYVVGASDCDASAQISVSAGYSGSSMHKKPGPESREIPTRSLDSIVAEQELPTPFLIKLDIEGHELRALEGAQKTLEQTDVVIAEISLWNDRKRETGGATLEDVFSHLQARGFVLYDIVDIGYRPSDGAMGLFDAVFVRGDCKIRELLAYRTKEQRAEINAHKAAKYARAKSELTDS
ncbi:MAG: FkbM family methyltransferase [Planctomycetota bacterium]